VLFKEGVTDSICSLGCFLDSLLGEFVVPHDGLHHAGGLNIEMSTFSRGQVKSCSEKAFC